MKKIAIIGGGASGLIAAFFASRPDHQVTLFEKQGKLGRKIATTGNGRCNITNQNLNPDKYYSKDPNFIKKVLAEFGLDKTKKFFQKIGLPFLEGEQGKLYPASWQAITVVNLLSYQLKKKRVEVKLNRQIEKIDLDKKRFKLTTTGKETYFFDKVILATGSQAHPPIGGSKKGYELSSSLGHKINPPFPAILPLNIPLKILHRLQGIKWNCLLTVKNKNEIITSFKGELLFTGYGLSGPAALSISRSVNELILKNQVPEIIVDFFPKVSEVDLLKKFNLLWHDKEKKVSFSLLGIINDKIAEILLSIAGFESNLRVKNLTEVEKNRIIKIFKGLSLSPGKPRSFNEAVVAAGGVETSEVNPTNMESKIVKNLYLTGELLDVDGQSGGYNLQFAWSSGALAGLAQ